MSDREELLRLLLRLSVGGLVAAVWFAGLTLWAMRHSRRRQELNRRLKLDNAGGEEKVLRLWHEGKAVETRVAGGARRSWLDALDQLREDAGWVTPIERVLATVFGSTGVLAILVYLVTGRMLLGLAAIAVVLIGFRAYLLYCVTSRNARFEKQLVDALDLGARSLRAGHPLSGAFRLIAEEIPAPLNAVFAEIVDQESMGVSIQHALQQASDRSRSPDMKIFAASVVIQLRSGGNLAEMMERVAWVVRERMRLNRRARVLTAEARLSKWVLLAIPIGLFLVLNFMNPEYMKPFFTTFAGTVMLVGCGIGLIVGSWVMDRMAVLKY